MTVENLWETTRLEAWHAALAAYPTVIARQGVRRLADLDRWYHHDLSTALKGRQPPALTLEELVHATEWKMARGVWRQRNLILVRSNDPDRVEQVSREAFAGIPDPISPVRLLAKLAGVGPATASAILAALAPQVYPFFDEIVADQIPNLGKVDFTIPFYARYAQVLRHRAEQLGDGWNPTLVEHALWVNVGGKDGLSPTPATNT